MRRERFTSTRMTLGAIVLVLVALVAVLRTQLAWDKACGLARDELPRLLGVDLGIVACEVDPLTQTITLHEVEAFEKGTHAPLFSAEAITVGMGGFSPLRRRLELSEVRVKRPHVTLDLTRGSADAAGKPKSKLGDKEACPLDALKRLEVASLDIQGAEVSVTLPEKRKLQLRGVNLVWKTRRGVADFRLETSQGIVNFGKGADLAVSGLRAEGGLDPGALELQISRAELTLEDLNVSLSGRVNQLCHPQLSLDAQAYVPLRTVGKATGVKTKLAGHVWAHAAVNGRLKNLSVASEILGRGVQAGAFHPGDFSARLSLEGPALSVHDFSFNPGGGTVHASGGLTLAPGLPLKLAVELKNASLGNILERAGLPGPWVDFAGTGQATLEGQLLPAPHLNGNLDLGLERFVLTPHAFDAAVRQKPLLDIASAHVQTGFRVLADRVDIAPAKVHTAHSTADVEASLFFNPERGLHLVAHSDALDLLDVGPLAGIPWHGHGGVNATITGPYSDLHIDGSVDLHDFEYASYLLGVTQGHVTYHRGILEMPVVTGQKGRTPYAGSVTLDFRGPALTMKLDAQMPQGRVEDLADMLGKLSPNIALLRGDLLGKARGGLHLTLTGERFDGEANVGLQDVTYLTRRLGNANVVVRFADGESLIVPPTHFVGPLGTLNVQGRYDFDGPLDFDFHSDDLSLAELFGGERSARLGVGGALVFAAKLEGTSDVPVLSAYLTSPRVTFASRSLGAMHLEARMSGSDLQVYGNPFADAHASWKVKLKAPYPYDANVDLALPEIRPLLPDVAASQGLSGALRGRFSLGGNLADMRSLHADGSIASLSLVRGDFRGQVTAPLGLSYARGRLTVEPFVFVGPNTELSLEGSASASDLDVKMRGVLDLRLFESFVPGLERAGGTMELTASATGAPGNPSLVGNAEVREGRFNLRDEPVSVHGLSGRLSFSASRVLIDDVTAVLNDGRLGMRGDLTLRNFAPDKMELGFQLDEVHFRLGEDTPFVATGELLLSGRPDALSLGGDLDLQKLRYTRPLEVESFLKTASGGRMVLTGSGALPREWLSLDVGLHLKDARVENNVARARLLGDLKLTGTNVHPGMLGTLEAGEGSQAFFRGTQFTVTQAVMEFKSRTSFDGILNVHAESQVRDYLVRLHGFGKPSDPQLLVSSEPSLSEGDILSLLTLGVTSRDKGDTMQAGIGIGADLLFTASGLDKQVQRFLPKNNLLRDLSFHISSQYSEVTGLVEPTAQLESKFLTEQLKLRISQPVSGRGTRAQAEYRFDDRVSAQAQWDNEYSETSIGANLGLDLKLRWEIE